MSDFKKKVRGYNLDIQIGSGGFGTVYHAVQDVLAREVAVKVIKEKYVNNPQFVRQFESEARIIARLEHIHIVSLYDYWRDPSGAYLIMRFLRGGSLRGFLKTSTLDVPQTVRVINQVAAALSFAHQHNVIHRDIKPENILLDDEGNAYLTDFGIAVDLRNQDTTNMDNISFGSPDYVAPEQLRDKIVTSRSDIYSLGIMLYELLAGERPFVSDDPKEIMKMQIYNPVPSLRLKRPDLPPEIDTVIWQSTAKNPSHRYDNILELAVAFQNIASKMDRVPSTYLITTQRHNRIVQPSPSNTAGSMRTENMDGDTTDFSIDADATGVLPELAGSAPKSDSQIDTLPDPDASDTLIMDDDQAVSGDPYRSTDQLNDDPPLNLSNDLDTAVLPDIPEPPSDDAMNTAVFADLVGSNEDDGNTVDFDDMLNEVPQPATPDPDILMTPVQPRPLDMDSPEFADETNRFANYRNLVTLTIEGEGPPNPYKGLRAFEESDAGTFFGREEIVARLVNDFGENESRFLALIGPSGSGKSSVVRAGMIPAFRRGNVKGSEDWFFSTMMPRDNPFRELREAILRVAILAPENWGSSLETDPRGLHRLLNQILPDDGSDLLLFIDQFEEVFTLGDDEKQREMFLDSLWYAVNQDDSRLRLVVTLRADFYDRPLHYAQFGQLLKEHTEVLLPLSLQELESTIVGPAARVGLLIEPALKNAILDDVHNQPGALPLLQYALTELYDRKSSDQQMLTHEQYQRIGGIEGALAQRAQEVYGELSPEQKSLTRKLFLRIIAIDDNGTITRRRIIWAEMQQGISDPELLQNVVDVFSTYRLLTRDLDQVSRAPTIEVAHEALIKGWKQLSEWIEQNRSSLQKRQELRVEVDRWLANGRDKSYLATGSRLAEFEGLVNNDLLSLRDAERDYILDGIAAREAAAERTRRINIALSIFSVVTLILFVIALFSFFSANDARAEAEEQAQVARARELAASSLANADQTDLSLLLAVEAMTILDTYESRDSLLVALQGDTFVRQYFQEHERGLRAVDFDSTGEVAVAGGLDADQQNSIIRWNVTTGERIGDPLFGHTSWINDIQLSPDNSTIASVSIDGTLRLWDMASGEELAVLEEHTSPIRALDFTVDGSKIVTAGEDGQLIIWDVASQTVERIIPIEPTEDNDTTAIVTFDVLFNSAGTLVIAGSDDNLIRLWDVETGDLVNTLEGHENWVRSVSYDPTETALISADEDGVVIFWNADDGTALTSRQSPHTDRIFSLSLSFDGRFMATSGADGQVILWQLAPELAIFPQTIMHRGTIWDVEFSPLDYRLLSASNDGDLLLSALSSIQRPGELLFNTNQQISEFEYDNTNDRIVLAGTPFGGVGNTIQVLDRESISLLYEINVADISEGTDAESFIVADLAVAEDGTIGALALLTGEVAVWDLETAELRWIDNQHVAFPKEIELTPDGQRLYSVDEAGDVILWDTATGDIIDSEVYAQSSGVTAMSISPNGQYLAIGGRESIFLWNLETQTLISDALTAHGNAVQTLQFDNESNTLFSGSRDRTIVQWQVEDGTFIQQFGGHSDWVLSLAISPDNETLISGDRTGAIIMREVSTGRQVGNEILGPTGWLTSLQFVDDATVLGSSREEGAVIGWTIDPEAWVELACNISNRTLDNNEQLQFIRDDDYQPRCE